jgi:hypothetical protein
VGGRLTALLFMIVSLMMMSCNNSSLSPSEYVKYVADEANGLVKTKNIGEVNIKVQYKPISYLIANEMRTNDISKADFDERKKELESMQYYNLTLDIADARNILNYNVSSQSHQQERIHYLSFGIQQDIRLMENGKELPCILYHFERTYDISKERTFLIAFNQDESTKDATKTFILDSAVLGIGTIKIQFDGKNIQELPKMKLK